MPEGDKSQADCEVSREAPQGMQTPEVRSNATGGATAAGEPHPGDAVQEGSWRQRAEAAERQRDEYFALARRTQADFENYRKRVDRDLTEQRQFALAQFLRDLLPVVDNLQRALEAARRHGETGPLASGVNLVASQLLDALGRVGVRRLAAVGERFDPMLHEAVIERTQADVPPGHVAEVLEPGYRLHDRILRPARVAVASRPKRSPSA